MGFTVDFILLEKKCVYNDSIITSGVTTLRTNVSCLDEKNH